MKNFFLYFFLVIFSLFYSTLSFTQEIGLKGIIKKQQDKIELIENNLKSLIGKLESRDVNKSISEQLYKIESDLSKITNQFKNLSEFAYELEFKINRIEKNLKLSPTLLSKADDINKDISLKSDIKSKTKIESQGLDSKTPGVLGFIKTDEKKSDKFTDNVTKNEKVIEQKKTNQYPNNPNDHFKLAEGYLLNDLNKAKLAFENESLKEKDGLDLIGTGAFK